MLWATGLWAAWWEVRALSLRSKGCDTGPDSVSSWLQILVSSFLRRGLSYQVSLLPSTGE